MSSVTSEKDECEIQLDHREKKDKSYLGGICFFRLSIYKLNFNLCL
jgi:hypothetical protein